MCRFVICLVVSLTGLSSVWADDPPATPAQSSVPKSYSLSLTKVILNETTATAASGLQGAALEEQLRAWRNADQLVSEQLISLTCIEGFKSKVQFGRRVAVVTGTSSFGGRTQSQSTWHDLGTLVEAELTSGEGHVIAELTYESSDIEKSDEEGTPGELKTITVDTQLILKFGEPQVISSSQGRDAMALVVRVAETGSSSSTRSTRSSPSRRPSTRGSSAARPANSADRYTAFAKQLFKKYDTNSDGVIDEKERSQFRGNFESYDSDEDGRLTEEELVKYFQNRAR